MKYDFPTIYLYTLAFITFISSDKEILIEMINKSVGGFLDESQNFL